MTPMLEIELIVRSLEGKISKYPEKFLGSLPAWKPFELSEILAELGNNLKMLARRASTPVIGWIPETGHPDQNDTRVAHRTGDRTARRGLTFISLCGAECYPFYGRDSEKKILAHPKCSACERLLGDQPTEKDHSPASSAGQPDCRPPWTFAHEAFTASPDPKAGAVADATVVAGRASDASSQQDRRSTRHVLDVCATRSSRG